MNSPYKLFISVFNYHAGGVNILDGYTLVRMRLRAYLIIQGVQYAAPCRRKEGR